MLKSKTILIWDSLDKNPVNDEIKILWRKNLAINSNHELSLPKIVEDNGARLKSKYLSFIYDIGQIEVSGKDLIKHFEINSGFSLWWMTSLACKNHYTITSQISNIIKILAFEEWLDDRQYSVIKIVTDNKKLAESVKILATQKGLTFKHIKLRNTKKSKKSFIRSFYSILPEFLKAIYTLTCYLMDRWKLKGVGLSGWKNSSAKITFFSYFFNIDRELSNQGVFKDKFWTELPSLLEQKNIKSNWLHIYIKSELTPSSESAKKLIQKFNKFNFGIQNHVFIESFLSFQVVLRVINNWIKLSWRYIKIKSKIKQKTTYFWPLIESDLNSSIVGSNSIQNLLNFELFRSAIQALPSQKKAFYLQENQGWESCLIYAWREFMQGQLIGVPHTTIRYWDLRYFFDKRLFKKTHFSRNLQPDLIAVNGKDVQNKLINGGYSAAKLFSVEALRYLFLDDYSKTNYGSSNSYKKNTLVIFTDYQTINLNLQLSILKKAIKMTNKKIKYIIKPHPANPLSKNHLYGTGIVESNNTIENLLDSCNVVFTSSSTSAAVEAYCAGKKIITFLDPNTLNFSPLRGYDDVSFISSAEELAEILNNLEKFNSNTDQGADFFYIDKDLTKWQELLV